MSKEAVRDFWNQAAAGEFWATGETPAQRFRAETSWRYHFEPYIRPFADFASGGGRDVLEIGVQLNHGNRLQSEVGLRHRGPLLSLAKAIWPRWLLCCLFKRHGLCLMITAVT